MPQTPLEKVCAVPYRQSITGLEVLAFRHPLAGTQFVKGTLEIAEEPEKGACRELHEESGLTLTESPALLGKRNIGTPTLSWHFYAFETMHLPESWSHWTEDGGGQSYSFFWHPLSQNVDKQWHPIFHQAFHAIRSWLPHTS